MELPIDVKKLYRHWPQHLDIGAQTLSPHEVCADMALWQGLTYFISERMSVWAKKSRGDVPPYSEDPILTTYRFCNIFRELDRQTIFFHQTLQPMRGHFPLWLLNMFYCRLVARTETVHTVGLLSFDEAENKDFYKRLMATGRPRFGTPYVFPVSTILKSDTPTREAFLAYYLPRKMYRIAQEIESWERVSVHDGVVRVLPLFGINLTFLWTEVLIDVAYQFPERVDLFARFPIGPGSLPTLRRIDAHEDPALLVTRLAKVAVPHGLTYEDVPVRLSAENWEGIGCEFRKYTNLKLGKGRKRLYR
ncbi:MAG: hypothetical protein KBE09_02405 [Candidatus Pacebacteria bacterium]|nr:hypothetical protein [Candidatus Paceibacterota bacterium]